jgi:hypothetical protein
MLEPLGGFVSKLATSLGGRAIDWAIERFKRPTIRLKRAPENVFEHIVPGTSLVRAQEVLGTPHRVERQWHSFSFSDAHVQIGSDDGASAQWIAVLLPKLNRRAQFPIPVGAMGSLALGKSTLADVLALAPDAKFRKDSSTKHWCFWIESYFGFSGLYRHYLFGVMEAPCAMPPEFEWDHANDRLASDPKTVRFNWAAISNSSGAAESFNFWSFV